MDATVLSDDDHEEVQPKARRPAVLDSDSDESSRDKSKNITDQEEESMIQLKTRRTAKKPAVLDSDTDDELLVPTKAPSDQEDTPIRTSRPKKVFTIPSSEEEDNNEVAATPDIPDSRPPSLAQMSMEEVDDEIERKIEKYRFSPKTRKSMGIARQASDSESSESDEEISNEINENDFHIPDGFSSTMVVPKGNDLLSVSTDQESEDSVVLLEAKVPMINISDDSPDTTGVIPPTPTLIKTERQNQSQSFSSSINKNKLVQPKITDFGTIAVPREVYDEQVQKLHDMEAFVAQQVNLYKTVGKTMFDRGEKLLSRINSLRKDVEDQKSNIQRLKIADQVGGDDGIVNLTGDDGEVNKENRSVHSNRPSGGAGHGSLGGGSTSGTGVKNLDWDDLEKILGSEKPKYVGKQGIKTFENQKAVTMDTLKEIHGSLSTRPPETAMVDTPTSVKVQLMDHQKNALAFMHWRESQRPRGGLLADDMGLGKTLTMLSLVASDLEKLEADKKAGTIAEEEESEEEEDPDESKKDKDVAPKKKGMAGWSAKGRKDHYEGGTLVVCPASLLQQWEGEVKSKLHRNKLNYLVYHGTKRDSRGRYLSEYDLVITTYSIASVDKKTNIGLYRVKWRRIILDEGHAIRNHKSQMSMAACDLLGKRRWLLTGTPIHNKEMDIYAVLKFIRCQPFSDLLYFKKWIDNKTQSGKERLNTLLKSIMLRRTKAELQAKGALQSLPTKTMQIVDVKMDKDEMNIYQRVIIYSRTLFAQFLDQRAEKVADGMRAQQDPSKDPNSVYYKIHKKMARMTKKPAEQVQQYQILVLLLRLRQICCHPGLINAMLDDPELAQGSQSLNETSDGESDHSEIDLLNQLEKLAIDEGVSGGGASMRDDSAELSGSAVGGGKKERIMVATNPAFDLSRPSSKMRAILNKVEELLQSDDKIVIVSQWTSVLNVLERYTQERNIPTTKLTGQVMVKNRGEVVDKFNGRDGPRIMFLSLSAGGVGLNLVAGNHLFLVDLHWNPQLEQQAQDRIYRFGQQKPVTIYKFVVSDSIEQRIQALQDHKMSIADAVLTGSKSAAGSKLTITDLKMLFDME